MSARLKDAKPRWLSMHVSDLADVLELELRVYPFPWTRGNFEDALASGNLAQVLRDAQGQLLGYLVALPGVDEMHLLNITVRPESHSQGYGSCMLDALEAVCRSRGLSQIWLEVRRSNRVARSFYEGHGFKEVGLRRAYYPADGGQREDATLMSLELGRSRA